MMGQAEKNGETFLTVFFSGENRKSDAADGRILRQREEGGFLRKYGTMGKKEEL